MEFSQESRVAHEGQEEGRLERKNIAMQVAASFPTDQFAGTGKKKIMIFGSEMKVVVVIVAGQIGMMDEKDLIEIIPVRGDIHRAGSRVFIPE